MTKYEKQILNALIDKYERSKSFIGANRVSQHFMIQIVKLFPEYADDAEYDLFYAVNESIQTLKSMGYVKACRQKNGVFGSVALNTDTLGDVYAYIDRLPKSNVVVELRKLLMVYKDQNSILTTYCARQLERLNANKSVEFFDDDIVTYESILKAIVQIVNVKNEMFERDFSIQVFGDSKAFEKIRSKVVSLLYEYGNFPEKETLLADLNIIKNPGHVYFKGKGCITVCGQTIDLSPMNGDIALSSEMLNYIGEIKVLGETIITIENLTTFHAFQCKNSFAIYLGGYHNSCRRTFIQKIYGQNQGKKYLHFGDIDAGGFYILQHLRDRTGIAFEPYHMDWQTLEKCSMYTKKLTENDRKRLELLLDGEFNNTVQYMLDHNCKLEQEAMDLLNVGI